MPPRTKRPRPPKAQTRRPRRKKRDADAKSYWDITHRPLQCLVFVLPLVLAYEIGMAVLHGRATDQQLAAQVILHWLFSLFGASGAYLPGIVLIIVLLFWQIASRYPWKIGLQPLAGMAGESVLWAIPLFFFHQWLPGLTALSGPSSVTPLAAARGPAAPWDDLLLSIGAGIYEELLFRLIGISLLTFLLIDTLGMKQAAGVALAVIFSSLLFGLHHYAPIGNDTWDTARFAFRTAAGAYLACVFVVRGFGVAVGCHAMYDIIATLSGWAAAA